jgi:hypothetical protein
MSLRPLSHARRLILASASATALAALLIEPALAQTAMKDRIVDNIANQMVSQIQTDSCPEFEDMLKNGKGGESGKTGGMMKKDPELRERFVNKVAGPLVNKMIDCDLLPGH